LLPTKGYREKYRAASSHAASGVPTVRTTSPGAEIRDEIKRRATQAALRTRYTLKEDISKSSTPAMGTPAPTFEQLQKGNVKDTVPLRQFHLQHGIRNIQPDHPTGIRKRQTARSKHVATFVEKSAVSARRSKLLAEIEHEQGGTAKVGNGIEHTVTTRPNRKNPVAISEQTEKSAPTSDDNVRAQDDDTDQLAEELAAFALELSRDEERRNSIIDNVSSLQTAGERTIMNVEDDDFIYETYVRVPVGERKSVEAINEVGLLIIQDEDEELWQTFVESDDDSEWDEDDPDSNGLWQIVDRGPLLTRSSGRPSCK
jgi:Transcription factor Iwr1